MNDIKKTPKMELVALVIFCIIFGSGLLIKATGILKHEPQSSYETDLQTDNIEAPSNMQSLVQHTPSSLDNTVIDADKNMDIENQKKIDITMPPSGSQTSETETEKPENYKEKEGIHSYQITIEDCTWEEALINCIQAGGYLVQINSKEEFDYLTEKLNAEGNTDIHFYLGGRREFDGTDYYWVNENNQFIGNRLNSPDSWSASEWYFNEPSYSDTLIGADGTETNISENVMNLLCVSEKWYLNDSSNDLSGNYSNFLSGKVGYIIEFD